MVCHLKTKKSIVASRAALDDLGAHQEGQWTTATKVMSLFRDVD